jgi:uncharacterized protein (TIGR02147 family)
LHANTFIVENRSLDFKTFLQEELILRRQRNSSYSLRSFAKNLKVSPSFLSKILNGQRRITDQVLQKMTLHLNIEASLFNNFKSEESKLTVSEIKFRDLQLEYFKMISDWYHYALIELTNLEGFKNSPEWISSQLGISVNQAKAATDRLINLELLEIKNGKLRPTSGGNTTTKNNFTDLAFKKMQDDLLKKAIQSLWDEDLQKRDHTSISMAIHPDDIPEVKKRLTKMRREICQFLERPQNKKPKQVYNLSLSFFALSKESP